MAKKVTIGGSVDKPVPFKVRVKEKQIGFYDNSRRREGDVFLIKGEHEFSSRWMERVALATPERTTGPNAAIREQHDQILSAAAQPGILTGRDDAGDVPDTGGNPLDA
jgi:hypothetical protein